MCCARVSLRGGVYRVRTHSQHCDVAGAGTPSNAQPHVQPSPATKDANAHMVTFGRSSHVAATSRPLSTGWPSGKSGLAGLVMPGTVSVCQTAPHRTARVGPEPASASCRPPPHPSATAALAVLAVRSAPAGPTSQHHPQNDPGVGYSSNDEPEQRSSVATTRKISVGGGPPIANRASGPRAGQNHVGAPKSPSRRISRRFPHFCACRCLSPDSSSDTSSTLSDPAIAASTILNE